MRFKEFATVNEGFWDWLTGGDKFEVKMPSGKKEIKDLQKALQALGFSVGPPGIDGIIGPYTQGAIKKYQASKQFPAGNVTPDMVAALNADLKAKPELLKTLKPSADVEPQKAITAATDSTGKGKNKVSPSDISSYLESKGLDRNHILGMLANIERESGFNSGAYNKNDVNGPSGGLFQHHDNLKSGERRFSNMVAAAGEENWSSNWQAQLDFALSEPDGRSYLAKSFSSPEAATEWWVRHFERPANVNQEVALRQSNLTKYA